jgi:hypothetical protein
MGHGLYFEYPKLSAGIPSTISMDQNRYMSGHLTLTHAKWGEQTNP